jgi:hypothetical protein
MAHVSRGMFCIALVLVTAASAAAQPEAPPAWSRPAGAEATFTSASAMPWEVMVDQQSACITPCQLLLDRPHWITLRTQERRPLRLEIGALGGEPTAVTAHDMQQGTYATGITFTALGGMALVTGITLGAVGCATDRDGMCRAGVITGGAGAVVTLGGIWLMRRALPRAEVRRLERRGVALYGNDNGGGIAGRF